MTHIHLSRDSRVLVVDDSLAIGSLVKAALESTIDYPVDFAVSRAECERLLDQHPERYPVAVVDLNLPDAPDGEAVDVVLAHGCAVIVLTGNMDEALHERISAKPISDYVIKQNPGSIETVQRGVRRILRNLESRVLLVDDSPSFRSFLKVLMTNQRLSVVDADNGAAALAAVERDPDIKLVVTDFEMPGMDGVHLCAAMRAKHSSSRLAVIGLTGSGDNFIGVKFLKAGADDIVRKPFLVEEFIGRINNCLDHLDNIRLIEDQANRDYLTKLYNRRYLFSTGNLLYEQASKGRVRLAAVMVDIDFFKKINDTYGHDCGDKAIVAMAETLTRHFPGKHLVARMGGEEFCILAVDPPPLDAALESLRAAVAELQIAIPGGGHFGMTTSIGAFAALGENLDDMINRADQALYQAKNSGRNRVVMENPQ